MLPSDTTLIPVLTSATNPPSAPIPAEVSVFYSFPYGGCWAGLTIDSTDNLYPVNTAGVYKILPNGTLVNGINDANLFVYGTETDSAALDDKGGMFYSIGEVGYPYTIGGPFYVSAAPFSEGSRFAPLIFGLSGTGKIVLGQGPLQKTLFIDEIWQNKVARISLSPLVLTEFGNSSVFSAPSAIASAADGTIYVSNLNIDQSGLSLGDTFITKIAPDGTTSRFLNGSGPAHAPNANDILAVDKEGNVYWGNPLGINKYDPKGSLLGTLPGPPDRPSFSYPFGGVFDSRGSFYLVENEGCRKIYKYTFLPQPKVSLSIFFADPGLTILPAGDEDFKLNVVIANSFVRGTDPGVIRVWVSLTNTGPVAIQSLRLMETLPTDWVVQPAWLPAVGAVHLYLANTTSLATDPEITQPSIITLSMGNPEIVNLTIQSFNATAIGHPLLPDQSILLSVEMSYSLRGTMQPAGSYPRTYFDTAAATAWPQASFVGVQAPSTSSASLVALAKVPHDVN